MGGTPQRHGHGGWARMPVPLDESQIPARRVAQAPSPGQTTGERTRAIPVEAVDAFLSALPRKSVQQLALHDMAAWDLATVAAGSTITISGLQVPQSMVYVFTDVFFYGLTPSGDLAARMERLPSGALAGLVRFQLVFNERQPLQMEGSIISPYGGTAATVTRRAGWPFVDRAFGTQRETSFAVYADELETMEARAIVDVLPAFLIRQVGVELNGFAVSKQDFGNIWPVR